MGELWDGITGFFGNISEYVRNYQISAIVNRMQLVKCRNALDNVYNLAPPWLKTDEGVKDFYDMRYAEFTDSGTITIADAAKGPGVDYIKAFIKEFEGLYEGINETVGGTIAKLYTTVFPKFTGKKLGSDAEKKLSGTNIPEALEGILDSIVDIAMDPFLKTAKDTDSEVPEEAKKAIKEILKMGAGLGATVGLSGYVMEHFHPTKSTNAARSLNMILELVGFKSLRDAYIKPLKYNLIELPLRYKWNELLQAQIPPLKDAIEWYGRGHIDEDEMAWFLKKNNISTRWQYRYQRMGSKPSSYFMLNAIGREGFWDPEDFLFWLSDAGYGAFQITDDLLTPYEVKYKLKPPKTTQINFLLDAYKHMNIRTAIGDVRSMQKVLFAAGQLTRSEFEKILVDSKILPEDMKTPLDALEDLEGLKERKELQKAYEKKYLWGRITKDELESKLLELRFRKPYITARLKNLLVRKEGKLDAEEEGKTLTRGQIVNAYKYGQKPKPWAVKGVDDMGYATEDATLLVESVDQKIKNDTTKEWQRAYESRTLAYRMTTEELKGELIKLGKDEHWAEARVAYIEERRLGEEGPAEEEEEEEEETPEE